MKKYKVEVSFFYNNTIYQVGDFVELNEKDAFTLLRANYISEDTEKKAKK